MFRRAPSLNGGRPAQTNRRRSCRRLGIESLERRELLAADVLPTGWQDAGLVAEGESPAVERSPWHNPNLATDVNNDGRTTAMDIVLVVRALTQGVQLSSSSGSTSAGEGEGAGDGAEVVYLDVNDDFRLTAQDAIVVLRTLAAEGAPPPPGGCVADPMDAPDQLTKEDVCRLLNRAEAASASKDAIIAVVDRNGHILGVRLEKDVATAFAGDDVKRVFAIDGAVAKARTAAFFSSSSAPLTSRTIRFISQSTITQREVESNPNILDPSSPWRGPGFVAPIGVGGHFPPDVAFTPPVDLFGIEHQSRDSRVHPGADGIKGTADDVVLTTRFDADPSFIPAGMELEFPESYGFQSGVLPTAQSRGIATLPGGVPLYKKQADGSTILVGGIGVFFPGPDGYATYEQGFVPASANGGVAQSVTSRLNAPRVLESEWIAFAAAGGTDITLGGEPAVPGISLSKFAGARIDLVGITLEILGPHPTLANPVTGIERLFQVGEAVGQSFERDGTNVDVEPGKTLVAGKPAPTGWLIEPHASTVDPALTKAAVETIIAQGIAEANRVRAAIRLTDDLRPGDRTRMVFAVADTSGEVLGLYRMPDATIFSIDVAVAKARNTAYYAKGAVDADLVAVDVNGDGIPDDANGDGKPDSFGRAFTNRTFRFMALPRFPSGAAEGSTPGPFSSLLGAGINPLTAENLGSPLPASVYSTDTAPVLLFDAFNVSRNFRDPGSLKRQNGVVFFPGSAPLYVGATLVGGFGGSGDGVDQDDVVTAGGLVGFDAPFELRSDLLRIDLVRLPYIKYLRNPLG